MANSRRLRRGVVKQLSNLSIDEVSLVDRGANQHALISIAKRAPQADDYFEKSAGAPTSAGHTAAVGAIPVVGPYAAAYHNRQSRTGWKHGGLKTFGGELGGSVAGQAAGGAIGGALGGAKGRVIGSVAGSLAGAPAGGAAVVHHHHYNLAHPAGSGPVTHEYGTKAARAPEETLNVDDLFSVDKKSSFGRGGQQAVIDEFSGDDPAGVTDDENGEKGDVGPGKKISGIETTEGEDTPPQKSKKKSEGGDINPSKLSGLGKSADFWKNVVSKVLEGEEFTTDDDDYDETVGKHFPGGMGGGMGQAQNPMQSPFPGAQGPGMAPTMQTPGVQPMGMGQPTPPPGGGMGQALPPDVVQYIQQLEQMLDQLTGGSDQDGSDDSQSDSGSNGSDSSSNDDTKKNPFGKSLETSGMDETTFLTELAKSLDDEGADREAVNKALEIVSKAEQRAKAAEEIAKAERDLRLEREFVAKAAEFNLPVKSTDLGPVLKRAAENLDTEDFKTIVKCLRAASASEDFGGGLYGEVGKRGGGDNSDILSNVEAAAQELVGKSAEMTPEAATLQVLMDNPAAYDEYLRDHPSRRAFR